MPGADETDFMEDANGFMFRKHTCQLLDNIQITFKNAGPDRFAGMKILMKLEKICCHTNHHGIPEIVYLLGRQLEADAAKKDMLPTGELQIICMKRSGDPQPLVLATKITDVERKNIYKEEFGGISICVTNRNKLNNLSPTWKETFDRSSNRLSNPNIQSSFSVAMTDGQEIVNSKQLQIYMKRQNGMFFVPDKTKARWKKKRSDGWDAWTKFKDSKNDTYEATLKVSYSGSGDDNEPEVLWEHPHLSMDLKANGKLKQSGASHFFVNFQEIKDGSHTVLTRAGTYEFQIKIMKNDIEIFEKINKITIQMAKTTHLNIKWKNQSGQTKLNVNETMGYIQCECRNVESLNGNDSGSSSSSSSSNTTTTTNSIAAMLTEEERKILPKCVDIKLNGVNIKVTSKLIEFDTEDRSRFYFKLIVPKKFKDIPIEGKPSTVRIAFKNELSHLSTTELQCLLLPGRPKKITQNDIQHSFAPHQRPYIKKFPTTLRLGCATEDLPRIYINYRDCCGNPAFNIWESEYTIVLSCEAIDFEKVQEEEEEEDDWVVVSDTSGITYVKDEDELPVVHLPVKSETIVACQFDFGTDKVFGTSTPGEYHWTVTLNEDDEEGGQVTLKEIDGMGLKGKIHVVAASYTFGTPNDWEEGIDYVTGAGGIQDVQLTVIVQNNASVSGLTISMGDKNDRPPTMNVQPEDESWNEPKLLTYDENTKTLKIPTIEATTKAGKILYKITAEGSDDPKYFHVQTLASKEVHALKMDTISTTFQSGMQSNAIELFLFDSYDNRIQNVSNAMKTDLRNSLSCCIQDQHNKKRPIDFFWKENDENDHDKIVCFFTPKFSDNSSNFNADQPGMKVHLIFTKQRSGSNDTIEVFKQDIYITCGEPKYLCIKDPDLNNGK